MIRDHEIMMKELTKSRKWMDYERFVDSVVSCVWDVQNGIYGSSDIRRLCTSD